MHLNELVFRRPAALKHQGDMGSLCKLAGIVVAHGKGAEAHEARSRKSSAKDVLQVISTQLSRKNITARPLFSHLELVEVVPDIPA